MALTVESAAKRSRSSPSCLAGGTSQTLSTLCVKQLIVEKNYLRQQPDKAEMPTMCEGCRYQATALCLVAPKNAAAPWESCQGCPDKSKPEDRARCGLASSGVGTAG